MDRDGPILVAGGRGFVGSHVLGLLLDRGVTVISVDSGLFEPAARFKGLSQHRLLTDITADAADIEFLRSITRSNGVLRAVVNCAGPARASYYRAHPSKTAVSLLMSALSLMRISIEASARFVHSSSSEVYGDIGKRKCDEADVGHVSFRDTRSSYAESKRACEALMSAHERDHNLHGVALRLFNVFGSGYSGDDDRVIPSFLRAALSGKPLTVFGDGEQRRAFCHVSDVAEAFVKIIEMSDVPSPAYNVGREETTSINDLISSIGQKLGKDLIVDRREAIPDEIRFRAPNNQKAILELDWKPKMNFSDGLGEMISNLGG